MANRCVRCGTMCIGTKCKCMEVGDIVKVLYKDKECIGRLSRLDMDIAVIDCSNRYASHVIHVSSKFIIEVVSKDVKVYRKQPTLVFDFDGVIHSGYDGWRDGSIYGSFPKELEDYMRELLKNFNIAISTCRDAKQVYSWLSANSIIPCKLMHPTDTFWNTNDVIGISNKKIAGIIYIDDRGYAYDGDVNKLKKHIGG